MGTKGRAKAQAKADAGGSAEHLALVAEYAASVHELEQCAHEYLDQGLLAQSADATRMAEELRTELQTLRASLGLTPEEYAPSP
jgi:hypothetical protein